VGTGASRGNGRRTGGFSGGEALSPASKRLIEAIKLGDQARVLDNLDKATVNASGGPNGLSPLHHCAGADGPPNSTATMAIINIGGNIHAQDNVGETPLHTAAKRGAVEVARILIEHGLASTMIPTKNGETPLHAVASHGMTDMAHFLISKNVDVNARDYEFMTPLHVAAEYFAVPVAEALLANGADVNLLDMNGKSALHYAAVSGEKERSTELVALLLKHGANPHVPDYKNPPVTYAFKPVECCKEDGDYPAVERMLTEAGAPAAVESNVETNVKE